MKNLIVILIMSTSVFAGDPTGGGGGVFPTKDGMFLESLLGEKIEASDIGEKLKLEKLTHVVIKESSIERVKYVADVLIEEDKISNLTYNNILFDYEKIKKKLSENQGIIVPLNK